MVEDLKINDSKYALKISCVHYSQGVCKILNSTQTGKLNCELCRCSFFETNEVYYKRQAKFNERVASAFKNLNTTK